MNTQTLNHRGQDAHRAERSGLGNYLKRIFNWELLKETVKEWGEDDASRLAASLAYYTVTAMAQLLIGILAIAGFVFSTEQTQAQLVAQANRFIGAQGAEMVQTIVQNADQPQLARTAGIFALVLLLWSASNIFVQLKRALDTVWGVELRRDLPLWEKIKRRLMPILIVFGIGILVILATVAGTALNAASSLISDLIPGGAIIWQILNHLLTLAIITLLFALIFKWLPDVEIAWKDVWPGAVLTALLFVVGQIALSWYLGQQSGSSVYGAAGSLIVVLLWIYYSAQIFLFGAEYTQVYATRYGNGVRPDDDAVPLGSQVPEKAAARSKRMGDPGMSDPGRHGSNGNHQRLEMAEMARTWDRASYSRQDLGTLGALAGDLGRDWRTLITQEMRLASVEMRETLRRAVRGIGLSAGGGMLLYAAALLILAAVVVALHAIMPFWVAASLVGLLLLIEGWLLTLWARQKLGKAVRVPREVIADSVSKDVETVKAHLGS
jgi:membrane protein